MKNFVPSIYRSETKDTFVCPAATDAEISIVLHLHPEDNEEKRQAQLSLLSEHPQRRRYLDGNSIKPHCSASKDVMSQVSLFLKNKNLDVTSDKLTRSVNITASIKQISELLGITFFVYENDYGTQYISYQGQVYLEDELKPHICHISGLTQGKQLPSRKPVKLDRISQYNVHNIAPRHQPVASGATVSPPGDTADANKEEVADATEQEVSRGYTPGDIEETYQFPDNDAAGECIGIIELGGRYRKDDLVEYCKTFELPVPEVVQVGEIPDSSFSNLLLNNLEVTMDLQLAAGLAPGAKLVVYYAATISDALKLAVNDNKNKPGVISVSWAIGESDISIAELSELQHLTQQASLKGITLLAASGDNGYLEVNKKMAGVNYPAALPQFIAVGGTALWGNRTQTVWNQMQQDKEGSGGGYSRKLPASGYQIPALAQYSRMVPQAPANLQATPDMAANASTQTAYAIHFSGQWFAMGAGTSASTPVMAALITRVNKVLGYRLGFITPFLYQLMHTPVWNSSISGNNGMWSAAVGWDPCTGLGCINGKELVSAMKAGETKAEEVDGDSDSKVA